MSTLRYLPSAQAYDLWAKTYDTDGNILQAIDDFQLRSSLFPTLLSALSSTTISDWLQVIDLGAGTGRATIAFVDTLSSCTSLLQGVKEIQIRCLDSSEGMLSVARKRIAGKQNVTESVTVTCSFEKYDIIQPNQGLPGANILYSALVLEHIPLETFFLALHALVVPNGFALITNMHEEMGNTPATVRDITGDEKLIEGGAASGAGFMDDISRSKVRVAEDFAHSLQDVLRAAQQAGFELVGDVKEQQVEDAMLEGDGAWLGKRGKKWLGINVWFGILLRKM